MMGKHEGLHMQDYVDGTITTDTDLKEIGEESA
jgi:hypothetical protein